MSLRPCLKSSTTTTSAPTASPLPPRTAGSDDDYSNPLPYYQPYVHFPPSPSLSTTHPTHSRATYDRSPIVVAPNECALPARGCPGRTYTLCGSSSSPSHSPPASPSPVHRRSSAGTNASCHNSYTSYNASPPRSRTPHPTTSRPRTPHGVPSLIPDEGSSEESDGIASPPEYHQPSRHTSAPSSASLNSRLASLDQRSPKLHRSRTDQYLSSSPPTSFTAWGSDVNCLGGF